MAHFQVFIPNVVGAGPEHLVNAGLASLAVGAFFQDSTGPEGQRGVLVAWPGNGPKRLWPYDADKQKWAAGPERAYWVGYPVDDPPTEAELMRDFTNQGTRIHFNEEVSGAAWLIPRSESLDRALVLQDDGSMRFEPLRKFGRFNNECERFREKLTGTHFSFDWSEMSSLVTAALDINYRMPVPLAEMLGLYTKQTMVRAALAAACTAGFFAMFESGELELKVS